MEHDSLRRVAAGRIENQDRFSVSLEYRKVDAVSYAYPAASAENAMKLSRRAASSDRDVASEATEVPIPVNYPVFGRDAFRTATGVHAAAIIKARRKGQDWLADRIYSGVPAGMVGRQQAIEVGFMSGMSNVVFWLHEHGIDPEQHLVEAIFTAAKERNRVLTDEELMEIVKYETAKRDRSLPLDTLEAWKQEIEGAR